MMAIVDAPPGCRTILDLAPITGYADIGDRQRSRPSGAAVRRS
jgi:hypothetical protein